MSRVAFFVDVEHGHVLATCDLARKMQLRGHLVWYLAPPDSADLVRREGFEVVEVLEEALPIGSTQALQRQADYDPQRMLELALQRVLPSLASGRGLGPALARVHPDLLVMNSLFQLEALAVHLRHHVRMALLTTNVRLHARAEACRIDLSRLFEMRIGTQEMVELVTARLPGVHSLDGLADTVLALPSLTTVPKSLDLPGAASEPETLYVGSGVERFGGHADIDDGGLDPSLPLIYCSLGSQAYQRWAVRKRFFEAVLGAAARRPAYQVLLVAGPGADVAFDHPVPSNVQVRQWVSQLAVLRHASLTITHGGAGTLKECIAAGVPTLAFAIGRDQFAAAQRVAHHGIGLVGNIETVSAVDLMELMDRGLHDRELRLRVARMRDALAREDAAAAAMDVAALVLGPSWEPRGVMSL